MTRLWTVFAVCVLLALSVRVDGHHNFADFYLESDTMEVDGEVVEFQYKNPHAWIYVQAPDPFGTQKIYAGEWVSVARLERDGIKRDFFRAGDHLRMWVSPNRNPNDNRVRIKRMERRSDKWKWGANRTDTR